MTRWSLRLRRAASLLLGVHLLQIVLLAASAVCELSGAPVQSAAAAHTTGGAHHHEAASGRSAHGGHHGVTTVEQGDAAPPAHHHMPSDAGTCPMAMACTVTAVVARVPAIETHVVTIATSDISQVLEAPASTRRAPEPPPPRA